MKKLACIAALLVGCGGAPGANALCHDQCQASARCGAQQTQVQQCNTSCDQNTGAQVQADAALNGSCKNADQVRTTEASCFATADCSMIQGCQAMALSVCVNTH